MKGVLDLVNEFHTFNAGSCASGLEAGCRHGGCWREDMDLKEATDNGIRCLNSGEKERQRSEGRGTSIKKENNGNGGGGAREYQIESCCRHAVIGGNGGWVDQALSPKKQPN